MCTPIGSLPTTAVTKPPLARHTHTHTHTATHRFRGCALHWDLRGAKASGYPGFSAA